MATVEPVWAIASLPQYLQDTVLLLRERYPNQCATVTWADVNGGDTCTEAPVGWIVDKSVQISGGTVTSVAIHGSNDNVEYYTLTDPQGNALTGLSAETIKQLLENTLYLKPVVTTGTGVDIVVFGRIPE
jgi:hypothetical protein